MATITLKLPDALVERAGGAVWPMHRPLEDVLAAMLGRGFAGAGRRARGKRLLADADAA